MDVFSHPGLSVGRSWREVRRRIDKTGAKAQFVTAITVIEAGQRASLSIESFPQPKEAPMLSLLAFVVVAVALATPLVVPLMWGQLEKAGSPS